MFSETSLTQNGDDSSHSKLLTDGGRQRDKRQIGPRLDPDLADDFEFLIRHLHNGKYKGRLSDEVEAALQLYMGKVLTDHATWVNDADEERQERFKEYTKRFQDACSTAPGDSDSEVAAELRELRQQVEAVNATSTNMLSQILTQVNSSNSSTDIDRDDLQSADT